MNTVTTCAKQFQNLPFAHRQHNHDGHCSLIHGHNWTFEVEFACRALDENQFVIDFGKLKFIREWLEQRFDHTLVLNEDDPFLDIMEEFLTDVRWDPNLPNSIDLAKIVKVPNCGAEGLAAYALRQLNELLRDRNVGQDRGLHVRRVTLYEDDRNSATVQLEGKP